MGAGIAFRGALVDKSAYMCCMGVKLTDFVQQIHLNILGAILELLLIVCIFIQVGS